MITFYEMKSIVARVFGVRKIEDNDEDIIVKFPRYRHDETTIYKNESKIITNDELKELYDKVCAEKSSKLQLYTGDSYEIAVDLDYFAMRRQRFPMTSEDTVNGVHYELSYPTVEYAIFLLMSVKDAMNQQQLGNTQSLPIRLRHAFGRIYDEEGNYLEEVLPQLVDCLTLKIKNTSDTSKTLDEFCTYKTSFTFEFMYKTGNALIEYCDIIDMFPMNTAFRGKITLTEIDTPPLRKYTDDVVDYYRQALASNDPYIQFISFYHVMEYFYDEVFKRKLVVDLKDKITHPDFSYKSEDKIYDLALFIKNRMRMNDETGHGNELESLKFVLNEYVSIDELKQRINMLDEKAIQYYQTNKVIFSNAPVITWSDEKGLLNNIARRIYFTRNSLVHSKSGKNNERYHPYKDEKQLQLEIPLVRAVAELIIIHSSEII